MKVKRAHADNFDIQILIAEFDQLIGKLSGGSTMPPGVNNFQPHQTFRRFGGGSYSCRETNHEDRFPYYKQ